MCQGPELCICLAYHNLQCVPLKEVSPFLRISPSFIINFIQDSILLNHILLAFLFSRCSFMFCFKSSVLAAINKCAGDLFFVGLPFPERKRQPLSLRRDSRAVLFCLSCTSVETGFLSWLPTGRRWGCRIFSTGASVARTPTDSIVSEAAYGGTLWSRCRTG